MAQPRLAHAEQFAKHVARRPPPVKPAPAALALRWATSIFLLQASATGACTTRAHPPLAYALERIRRRPRSTSHGTQWPLPRLADTSLSCSRIASWPARGSPRGHVLPTPRVGAVQPAGLPPWCGTCGRPRFLGRPWACSAAPVFSGHILHTSPRRAAVLLPGTSLRTQRLLVPRLAPTFCTRCPRHDTHMLHAVRPQSETHGLHAVPTARHPCVTRGAHSPRPMFFGRCPRPDAHVLHAAHAARDPCSACGAHGVLHAVPTACHASSRGAHDLAPPRSACGAHSPKPMFFVLCPRHHSHVLWCPQPETHSSSGGAHGPRSMFFMRCPRRDVGGSRIGRDKSKEEKSNVVTIANAWLPHSHGIPSGQNLSGMGGWDILTRIIVPTAKSYPCVNFSDTSS